MKRFPESVRDAMSATGAAATCLPVQLDGEDWETAVFLQVAGQECKQDRRAMAKRSGTLALGIETDLIEHEQAAVIVLRFQVFTQEDDPLVGEVLFTSGSSTAHFDALKLLSRQPRLCWFFGDQSYWIIRSQQHALATAQHREFEQLLADALRHDTMVRLAARYDASAALSAIVSRYELRASSMSGGARILRTQDPRRAH